MTINRVIGGRFSSGGREDKGQRDIVFKGVEEKDAADG